MTDLDARAAIIALIITLAKVFLMPWLVMILWNEVATTLFNAPVLTYWYSVGLCILTGWLIRGSRIQRDKE